MEQLSSVFDYYLCSPAATDKLPLLSSSTSINDLINVFACVEIFVATPLQCQRSCQFSCLISYCVVHQLCVHMYYTPTVTVQLSCDQPGPWQMTICLFWNLCWNMWGWLWGDPDTDFKMVRGRTIKIEKKKERILTYNDMSIMLQVSVNNSKYEGDSYWYLTTFWWMN